MSIRSKLIFFISLLIIFLDTLLCMLFLITLKKQHINDLQKLGRSLIMQLEQDNEVQLAIDSTQRAFLDTPMDRIQSFDRENEIAYWRIANRKAVILEGKSSFTETSLHEIPTGNKLANTEGPVITFVRNISGEEFLDFFLPLYETRIFSEEAFASRIYGVETPAQQVEYKGFVQIGLSTHRMNKKIYHIILYTIIPTGFGIILGGTCLTIFLSKYIVSPLRSLTRLTQDIAKGKLSRTVNIRSNDEIGQLSVNFNEMIRVLEKSYNELKYEISERKRTEEQLEKISLAVEHSPAMVVITDNKGNIEYVNSKFTQVTGYQLSEVIGQNPRFLKSGETPDEEYANLWNTINSGGEWRGEFYNKKKNGEYYWDRTLISSVKNSVGEITHFLSLKENVTEQKNYEAKLLYLSEHDALTKLYNRHHFCTELETSIEHALRNGTNCSLLLLNVDNFKDINDVYGHHTGDTILLKLANLLHNQLRETDVLARLGSDEYAVILPAIVPPQSTMIANRILELIRKYFKQDKETTHINITASIGIVVFPKHGDSVEALLAYADLSLHKAKEEGRNRVSVFSPEHKRQHTSRINWERQIRDALSKNLFILYLQPIKDIKRDMIVGYETLLRIKDIEQNKLLIPGNFIKAAERIGLIHEIDRWTVRNAIKIIAEHQYSAHEFRMEVNLSGKVLTDTEMVSIIKKEIEKAGINPKNLVFEITESAAIENILDAKRFIHMLKKIGCQFALDDFGIGFSSFNYLKQFPIDYLKIDGSFIRHLHHNTVDQHLVKAMVEVTNGLGKKTIAEFVENEAILHILRNLGVDYAQGNYVGEPKPVSEVFKP